MSAFITAAAWDPAITPDEAMGRDFIEPYFQNINVQQQMSP